MEENPGPGPDPKEKQSVANKATRKLLKRLGGPNFNKSIRAWPKKSDPSKSKDKSKVASLIKVGPATTKGNDNECTFLTNTVQESELSNDDFGESTDPTDAMQEATTSNDTTDNFQAFLSEVASVINQDNRMKKPTQAKNKSLQGQNLMKNVSDGWNSKRSSIHESLISFECPEAVTHCGSCCDEVKSVIRCKTCFQMYCETCDRKVHLQHPFHDRSVFVEQSYVNLLPNTFVVGGLQRITRK